jgi:hypothetical protein
MALIYYHVRTVCWRLTVRISLRKVLIQLEWLCTTAELVIITPIVNNLFELDNSEKGHVIIGYDLYIPDIWYSEYY